MLVVAVVVWCGREDGGKVEHGYWPEVVGEGTTLRSGGTVASEV